MPALTLTLPPSLDDFVQDQVQSGAYPDAETLVHEALLRMMPPGHADAVRTARFNALIQEGLDDAEAGRVEVVDDIGGWLDGLGRRAGS